MISRRFIVAAAALSGVAAIVGPAIGAPGDPRGRDPRPLIVLDPGHGGSDPGAIGLSGTLEKHIVLAVAQDLRRRMLDAKRYRVELTRNRDVFIPLEERVESAQRRGAGLFISLHADAMHDPQVRGASVYTLNETASDSQTAALAQRENSADRFGVTNLDSAPPDVTRILVSLVRRETRAGSSRMARAAVQSLGRAVPMLPKPSRHAGFMVLRAADVPSVLVELGFISNAADEVALRRPAHRAALAASIHQAVDAYFRAAARAGV